MPKPAQTYEPEVPVEVREWIAPAPSPPDFVLGKQGVSFGQAMRLLAGADVGASEATQALVTAGPWLAETLAACLLTVSEGGGERRPSLIVAPASLIANWAAEAERFAPSLNVFVARPAFTPAEL